MWWFAVFFLGVQQVVATTATTSAAAAAVHVTANLSQWALLHFSSQANKQTNRFFVGQKQAVINQPLSLSFLLPLSRGDQLIN